MKRCRFPETDVGTPTPEQREQVLRQLSEVLYGPGVLNAEIWLDTELPHERPGRLELPQTETVFVRVERLVAPAPGD